MCRLQVRTKRMPLSKNNSLFLEIMQMQLAFKSCEKWAHIFHLSLKSEMKPQISQILQPYSYTKNSCGHSIGDILLKY